MEWKDLAPWIAIAVTLILSILVPLFTQIANNSHQRKMQREKIEYEKHQKRIQAYETFLMNVGGAIEHRSGEALQLAGSSIGNLYLYVSEDVYPQLDDLYRNIREFHWEIAEFKFFELAKHISAEEQLRE